MLDPTLARTYVGRIVFASLCDKLFDIDDQLKIVPQLALSHATSEDGKTVTIRLRQGVKFHDGSMMDAEAVKASLERHMSMQGSFRQTRIGSRRQGGGCRSVHRTAATESPLLAIDRPASRPRRHDPQPQGDQGGRRQIRPKAGLCRPLQIRRARAAGSHCAGEICRLLERGECAYRSRRVSADCRIDRTPRQPKVGQPRPDRAGAGDRPQGDQSRPETQARHPD